MHVELACTRAAVGSDVLAPVHLVEDHLSRMAEADEVRQHAYHQQRDRLAHRSLGEGGRPARAWRLARRSLVEGGRHRHMLSELKVDELRPFKVSEEQNEIPDQAAQRIAHGPW